ncbi:hypothetical protein LTR56_002840 [Elasticomyces elasticus]|nr:hypothetical protein LTR56_002840 [Elasticomyces elasticus]KAK3666703.1 hypothetical protein LTR22_002290 [Elasticomyces elasticus]KAK4920455.1 hypothetical protein LTR49_012047 [Elasticomyces elasticus]KAK5759258.1 hypothetical protein LTS12_010581 [Elasticomyces elasticus]
MAEDRHTHIDKEQGSTKMPTKIQCRLLALPTELRSQIYEYVVLNPRPVVVTRLERRAGRKAVQAQPALSRTCRSIRMHVLEIYYSQLHFTATFCQTESVHSPRSHKHRLRSLRRFVQWLHCIGARNRGFLRALDMVDHGNRAGQSVDTGYYDPSTDEAIAELADLTSLGATMVTLQAGVFSITFPEIKEIEDNDAVSASIDISILRKPMVRPLDSVAQPLHPVIPSLRQMLEGLTICDFPGTSGGKKTWAWCSSGSFKASTHTIARKGANES